MAIDFGSMGAAAPATSTPLTDVTPAAPTAGITLDLNKGDMLNISKTNPGLTRVRLGAGWDVAEAGNSFDLDIAAFICGPNGKISSGADVVFFNNKTSQGVTLNGDNRTGAGDGDDETIDIDLSAVPASVTKIAFAVVIHDAQAKMQTFGMVRNSYVRLIDTANGDNVICRYELKDNYSTDTAVVFAELARTGSEWAFTAIGDGKQGDLNAIAALYQ